MIHNVWALFDIKLPKNQKTQWENKFSSIVETSFGGHIYLTTGIFNYIDESRENIDKYFNFTDCNFDTKNDEESDILEPFNISIPKFSVDFTYEHYIKLNKDERLTHCEDVPAIRLSRYQEFHLVNENCYNHNDNIPSNVKLYVTYTPKITPLIQDLNDIENEKHNNENNTSINFKGDCNITFDKIEIVKKKEFNESLKKSENIKNLQLQYDLLEKRNNDLKNRIANILNTKENPYDVEDSLSDELSDIVKSTSNNNKKRRINENETVDSLKSSDQDESKINNMANQNNNENNDNNNINNNNNDNDDNNNNDNNNDNNDKNNIDNNNNNNNNNNNININNDITNNNNDQLNVKENENNNITETDNNSTNNNNNSTRTESDD